MSRGRRYDSEPELNIKKVIAVIVAILVIIMFIVIIKKLLAKDEGLGNTEYFSVYTDNKWGVIDKNGEYIIIPKYDEMIVIPNSKRDVFICTKNVDYNQNTYETEVINSKEKKIFKDYSMVIPATNYDENQNLYYENNILIVKKKDKFGVVDFNDEIKLKCEYDKIETLKGVENTLLIWKDGKVGIADYNGVVVIEPKYAEIRQIENDYKNGFIVIDGSGKYGMIDFSGKVIFEPIYREIKPIASSTMYVVKEFEKFKIVKSDGIAIVEDFDDAKDINGDDIIFIKANKCGIVDKDKTEKVPAIYEDLIYAFDNYYIAKKDGKFGIISSNNEVKVDFIYSNIVYRKDAKFFELSTEGKVETVIMDSNLEIKTEGIVSKVDAKNNYFKMRMGNEYKYFNLNFEEKKAQDVLVNNTLFLEKQNGKYGYTDKSGNIKVECIYDDATEQNQYGFAAVKKDGAWGTINSVGKVIVEPKYNLDNNLVVNFIGKWHLGVDLNANYYTDK